MSKIKYERKPIPNFEGYEIDNRGDVWSCWEKRAGKKGLVGVLGKNWKKLKTNVVGGGYLQVTLVRNKVRSNKLVHRLVLEVFIGGCPKGMQACHNNGISTDNRLENLRWDTSKNNHADRIIHGTDISGEKNGWAKLNRFQVRRIKLIKEITPLITQKEIGRMFGVHYSTIGLILSKKRWKHITI